MKTRWEDVTVKELQKIQKTSALATAKNILGYLANVPPDVALATADVLATTKSGQDLLDRINDQIRRAYQNPGRFEKESPAFFQNIASALVEEKSIAEYMELYDFVQQKTFHDRIVYRENVVPENWLTSVYMSILAEIAGHLGPTLAGIGGRRICGIKNADENDFYYLVDPDVIGSFLLEDYLAPPEVANQRQPWKKMVKHDPFLRKMKNAGMEEVAEYMDQNNRIENMYLSTAFFISPETEDMLPRNPYPLHAHFMPPRIEEGEEGFWQKSLYYKMQLHERRYILPKSGIKASYRNAGNVTSAHFKEVYLNNRIVLLYRLEVENPFLEKPVPQDVPRFKDGINDAPYDSTKGSILGYYDSSTQFFYSPYNFSGDPRYNYMKYHFFLENFVLENYWRLTSGKTDVDRKRAAAIKIVGDLQRPGNHYSNQILVQYSYIPEEDRRPTTSTPATESAPFSPEEYGERVAFVRPFIRKLPEGWKASEEAVERARDLGYLIRPGETFVRAFQKTVRTDKGEG